MNKPFVLSWLADNSPANPPSPPPPQSRERELSFLMVSAAGLWWPLSGLWRELGAATAPPGLTGTISSRHVGWGVLPGF